MTEHELNNQIDILNSIATDLYYIKRILYFGTFIKNEFDNKYDPPLCVENQPLHIKVPKRNGNSVNDVKININIASNVIQVAIKKLICENENAIRTNLPDFPIDETDLFSAICEIEWDDFGLHRTFPGDAPNSDICDFYLDQLIRAMNIPAGDYKVIATDFDSREISVANEEYAEILANVFDSVSVYHGDEHLYDT